MSSNQDARRHGPSHHHEHGQRFPPPIDTSSPSSYLYSYTTLSPGASTSATRTGRDIAPPGGSSSNKRQLSPHRSVPTVASTTGTTTTAASATSTSTSTSRSVHDHVRVSDSRHNPDEPLLDAHAPPVDATMVDQRLPRVLQRDSHDLSLSPRNVTRDSLVTNMLMSLDQFSVDPAPSSTSRRPDHNHRYGDDELESPRFFDIPRYRPDIDDDDDISQTSHWRPRGHAPQQSYSSDLDLPTDDESSSRSFRYSRERRSNSSTTYQDAVYGRMNSRQPPLSRDNHSHMRGSRGSKSSSMGSADQTPPPVSANAAAHRWNRGIGRSASFDHSHQQARQHYQQHQQQGQHPQLGQHQPKGNQPYRLLEEVPHSPFQADFSFLNSEFDAAPTPTVPSGPRRTPSTPSIPPPPPDPAERPPTQRNHSSTRSLRSSAGRARTGSMRDPPSQPVMPTTPTAAVDLDSAPSPNVGYGKPKDPVRTATQTSQPKERPGFFKRVFGGGSSKAAPVPAPEPSRQPHLGPSQSGSDSNLGGRVQSQSKLNSTPPSRDTTSSHSNYPTLQKKPSSFFRRRKKSTIEEAPPLPSQMDAPPVPPMASSNARTDQEKFIPKREHSPASSLREVMNPFLYESTAGHGRSPSVLADVTNITPEKSNRADGYRREFSPDYEPSPNARIRKVSSNIENERSRPMEETTDNSFLDLDAASDNDDLAISSKRTSRRASRSARNTRDSKIDSAVKPQKKSSKKLPAQSESSSNLALPLEGTTRRSGSASPRSPNTSAPNVRIDTSASDQPTPKGLETLESLRAKSFDEPEFVVGEPTEDDRQKAQKIFDGMEDFIQKEKAASWMGEEGPVRQRTLQAYMELYDFSNQSVVYALRRICERLVFRAETQQVDRILVAFSKRWCACNPNHGFKATDVIHTICYSIMLLNTDLHMADIEQKMTRAQFIRNTMGTITEAITEADPESFNQRPSTVPEKSSMLGDGSGLADDQKSFRSSLKPPPRVDAQMGSTDDAEEDCGPLVKAPYKGSVKGWEEQVEIVLRTIYNSIRDERLPLFGGEAAKPLPAAPSQSSLSVMGMLRRTPSVLSKAPSDGNLSVRGRVAESRSNASRWASKSRSRPGLGRTGFNSSRTSFEDASSVWSPPLSSSATWSRQSLGRTQTSVSQDSLGSAMPRGDYQQSIGFANALSQAIIRDEDAYGNETAPSINSADVSAQLLEDESLEITGPPWVKEGMVIHKHHLDGVDKKAKERNWTEVFAVIQKGHMGLFSFSSSSKSARQKSRTRAGGPVGGGNWQDNATNVGSFSLRQTLASALPPPGYSRSRPHVWALSLPTGAVHLFQVGTPELIKEFVTTANYWSARLSTHPLMGGISNVEYGWSSSVVNNSLVSAINDSSSSIGRTSRPGSSAAHGRKSSVSSFRSASIDHATAAFTTATGRGKLPGDKIHIAEWTPPAQSLRPSTEPEMEQLQTLQAYVKSIEDELQTHNQLRSPMLLAFTPRGHNATRAMANWERKSAYLLREIVKFRTYVDCLQQAEARKQEIYAERRLAQRAARGELTDGDMEVSGDEEGDETLRM